MNASPLLPLDRVLDTPADKLLPRRLLPLAARPGSLIEVLNRAERLGVVEDVTKWLEAWQLRNRLIHEYMTDSEAFAEDLRLAEAYREMLTDTYRRVRQDAHTRMMIPEGQLATQG
jgi:hypothetical protein